ncbi:PEP-CTERM sorting domain-containing protein [bacterium]|nr:PEP-CTERM sorting domain-containing protein [bacterium]
MKRQFTLASIFLLSFAMTSAASADLIVDFTSPGANTAFNTAAGFAFSSQDPSGTGVSFTVTASAVIPAGGGSNGGDITRLNGGLGSTVENVGEFLNNFGMQPEVLQFTISGVNGLAPGESLALVGLLSQNGNSQNTNQSGGFGGTFGNDPADSVTLTSDDVSSVVINQSDLGDQGAILLNADNGQAGNTGNTFLHAGALTFTNSFTVALTDLNDNQPVVIQGFEFAVVSPVPEPSSASLLGFVGLATLVRRRKRRLA